MSKAVSKIKKAVANRREFTLSAEGAPNLKARIKAVTLGKMLERTGIADSAHSRLFDGSARTEDERNDLMPSYAESPDEFEEFIALGKRMSEAYIVLGVTLTDEEGDEVDLDFSDRADEDALTPLDLKEIYGEPAVKVIEDRVKLLSNGRAPSEVTSEPTAKRFPAVVN